MVNCLNRLRSLEKLTQRTLSAVTFADMHWSDSQLLWQGRSLLRQGNSRIHLVPFPKVD